VRVSGVLTQLYGLFSVAARRVISSRSVGLE